MATIAMSQYLNDNAWLLFVPMVPGILWGIWSVLPYPEV